MKEILKGVLLYALYVLTGTVGLKIGTLGGFATAVWYPSGIALAFLILYGNRLAPALLLGAFTVNYLQGAPVTMAAMIACGNTLEAVSGVWLLRRYSFTGFDGTRNVLQLVIYGALLGTLVSASIGTSALFLHHVIEIGQFPSVFRIWWLGDMMGILLATPLLLAWSRKSTLPIRKSFFSEISLITLSYLLLALLILHPQFRLFPSALRHPFIFYPVLIWTALRFETRGVSSAIGLLSILFLAVTLMGFGPFFSQDPVTASANVQIFFSITAITSLMMALVVRQRRQTTERVERLSRVKSDFVTVVTHELRTPLSSIKEGISLVLDRIDGPINPEQTKTLELVKRNVDRLGRLVYNVLDIQKLESDGVPMNFSPQDIGAIAKEIVETFRPESDRKQLRLSLNKERTPLIPCDADWIREVLTNLLSNALKFTPSGGEISVTVSQEPKSVQVEVRDSGIGIPKGDQRKVFEMFSQASHNSFSNVGGFGVGLAVCKRIIDAHQGRIWVESEEGKGSRFLFTLPVSKVG